MNTSFAENNYESLAEYSTFSPDVITRVRNVSMQIGRLISPHFISSDEWSPSLSNDFEERRAYSRTLQISGNASPNQLKQTLEKFIEENILQKFTEMLSLPPNWDSYNARPVATNAVEKALSWLASEYRENLPTPSIVPGSDGSVQIEWHVGDADLEVLFPPRSPGEYYWEWQGESSEGLLADSNEIDQYFGVLIESLRF